MWVDKNENLNILTLQRALPTTFIQSKGLFLNCVQPHSTDMVSISQGYGDLPVL